MVGTATPKEPTAECQAAWDFSTGDELMISWESSSSTSGLKFTLKNAASPDSLLVLLRGRKMQYQARKQSEVEKEVEEEDDEGFVTLIRFTDKNPTGKATALLNWKLLVIEFLPEEDAVLVLLLCFSILRSVSEMRKDDVGSLLIRRRIKETKLGLRDWGSVILHPSSSSSSSITSPYIQPWYWNAKAVMAASTDKIPRPPGQNYSLAEGGDKLYKRGIIT